MSGRKLAAPSVALFLDLETTGLYPLESGARILEIGMLAVSTPSFREIDSWSVAIAWDGPDKMAGCDDYVRKMHTESGLKADLERAPFSAGGPVPLGRALELAMAFYNKHASGRRVYLGGANPDFDRRWLDVHMNPLARKFSYRSFDTNAFFILREYLFGAEKSGQKHRVLDDCRQAVAVVHEHFALMNELFGGPRP